MRQRNTTGKIKDVYRLVLEATDSITPEAWKNCIRHVIEQEDYFLEMDAKVEAYENGEGLEDAEIGDLDKVLASDVALGHYLNPSCKLDHVNATKFAKIKNQIISATPPQTPDLPLETSYTNMSTSDEIMPGQSLLKVNNPNYSSNSLLIIVHSSIQCYQL